MEDLLSQFDADGAGFCDTPFALLDIEKQQQQQLDTTTANTPLIATLPTNAKIRLTSNTKKTHTQPKDQRVPFISNNNTNKKKKRQKKVILPKTKIRIPPKKTHEIKRPIVEVEEVK